MTLGRANILLNYATFISDIRKVELWCHPRTRTYACEKIHELFALTHPNEEILKHYDDEQSEY